jgi:hypothetical protein
VDEMESKHRGTAEVTAPLTDSINAPVSQEAGALPFWAAFTIVGQRWADMGRFAPPLL